MRMPLLQGPYERVEVEKRTLGNAPLNENRLELREPTVRLVPFDALVEQIPEAMQEQVATGKVRTPRPRQGVLHGGRTAISLRWTEFSRLGRTLQHLPRRPSLPRQNGEPVDDQATRSPCPDDLPELNERQ